MPRDAVWDVYDQFRTARLSCLYYSKRLADIKRWNLVFEIGIAVTASGSAIAALTFWRTELGTPIWIGLTVLSAIIADVKPFLKLAEKIQKFEELATGFGLLDHDYQKLVVEIRQNGALTQPLRDRFSILLDRTAHLKAKEIVEPVVNERLRRACREKVDVQLPTKGFFVPEVP